MFRQEHVDGVLKGYEENERWLEFQKYQTIQNKVGSVKNIFFGDSITAAWPLYEFFPNHSILNRGIGGDSVFSLYTRMPYDVFPYSPEKVFMLVGINGIQDKKENIIEHVTTLVEMMKEKGIEVYTGSILPLRSPDQWDRFQFQDKIVEINKEVQEWSAENGCTFLDYHSLLKDDTGQLAEEYARADGTHITFPAYVAMSELVAPYLAL